MAWIIMGIDECGSEFRANPKDFTTSEEAYEHVMMCRESYPEARSIWVEELKDKDYYMQQRMDIDEEQDYYNQEY